MAGAVNDWSVTVPLHALDRGPVHRRLEPDESERARIAAQLALPGIEALAADVTVSPWLDGAEVTGCWSARVVQECGVTLEPFATDLTGDFSVRAVPAGSVNAPSEDPEVTVELDAEDPPDVLHAPEIDIAALLVEHVALELDPFPRAPGVDFEPPAPERPISPFADLAKLKP